MNPQAILDALAAHGVVARRLCADSRRVQPGDIFVALRGARVDGRAFIADALARGAAAVVAEDGTPPNYSGGDTAPGAKRAPIVVVKGLAHRVGGLADVVYGHPSAQLWLAGVTGTNGKTSVTQWIAQAMGRLGTPCAVIGTLGSGLPGELAESPNTTPDAVAVHETLAGFVARGLPACAMEVSSIGIAQGRVCAARFAVAAFTNLTRDHLDYHGDMATYAEAKARLFAWPALPAAVINVDDAFGRTLALGLPRAVEGFACALDAASIPAAWRGRTLLARELDFSAGGVAFKVDEVRFASPVVGRFNVANLLVVIGVLRAHGHALGDIAGALTHLAPPPGRMQALGGANEPLVVVDYAHTPDALEQVLGSLRETARARGGRLHCVFGCGGDRDPGKRPLMGAIAERLADVSWVTSDNPRSEPPQAIIDQIVAGMTAGAERVVDAERGAAIMRAIGAAAADDVVLLAGKGHEPYQEIAGVRHAFSDKDVAARALAVRRAMEVAT